MTTYTTTQGQDFTIDYASSIFAGHGHQKITVQIVSENGNKKEFWHKTDNMPGYDEANDLDYGQEKFEALFELVESKLDGEICEWISETESYFYISGYLNGNEIGWITHDGKFSLSEKLDASSRMSFDTEKEATEFLKNLDNKDVSENFEYRIEKTY